MPDRNEQARRRLERRFWQAILQEQAPKAKKPKTGIQQEMSHETDRRLDDALHSLRHRLFILTPGQWNTLIAAGITPDQQELLGEIDHLAKPPGNSTLGALLEAIETAPESPEGWPGWWRTQPDGYIAVRLEREWRKPLSGGPLTLDGIIGRMAAASAPSLPTPASAAAAAPAPPERLSEALERARRTGHLAMAIGLKAIEYQELTPEELGRQLAACGVNCRPDIGTLQPPEEMRRQPGFPGPHGFRCDPEMNLWWTEEAAAPGGVFYHLPEEYQPAEDRETGNAERLWINRTAARLPDGRLEGLAGYARRYGLTPDEARRALGGEPPGEAAKRPCPLAAECPTRCGAAHRAGVIEFPPTERGTPEECRYHPFLLTHREQPGREQAAAELNAQLERRRRQDKKLPHTAEENPHQTEPEAGKPPTPQQLEIGW